MDATATAKLALDASGLDRGLQSATASLDKFAKQTGSVLAGAFAFDKLIAGFSSAIEKGDQFQDLANRFGVTAESLQEIGNAASLSGGSVEDVAGAMNKLAKNAGEAIGGNTQLEAAFLRIGVSLKDLQSLSPQDLFYKLSESISSGAIPASEQFALASDLAGKSVASLIETLRMGPDAIQSLGQSMGVMSNEQVANLSELSDQIKILQNNMTMAFGSVASLINPFIKGLQDALEVAVLLGIAVKEAATGNFDTAKEIAKRASGLGTEKMAERDRAEKAKKSLSAPNNKPEAQIIKSQKTIEQEEKDAIKERTDLALHLLKQEDSERKLADDSYERKRDIERERMLETANLEVKAAQEKMKAEKDQAELQKKEQDAAMRRPRLEQQARGGAAGEVLNFAAGLGDRGISRTVAQERAKAAKEQQKVNRKEFDAKVMEQTSATAGGAPRTMESRRREFIQKEAQKESKGAKTLADIYQVLNDALTKITSAPIVSA